MTAGVKLQMTSDHHNKLAIRFEQQDGHTLARLSGSLGTADAPVLTDELADYAFGESARLAVDLSGLTTLDSAGLSSLIHVVTRARMTGGRVVLVGPCSFVAGVFAVTNLDKWFDICNTVEEAAARLGQR